MIFRAALIGDDQTICQFSKFPLLSNSILLSVVHLVYISGSAIKFLLDIFQNLVLVLKDFTWKIIAESPLPVMKGYFEQAFIALSCTSMGFQGGISISEIYDKLPCLFNLLICWWFNFLCWIFTASDYSLPAEILVVLQTKTLNQLQYSTNQFQSNLLLLNISKSCLDLFF